MQSIGSKRPSDDPDYQRLVEVASTIEAEMAKVGAEKVLGRRFDYDVALSFSARRTEETSQRVKLENPDHETLIRLLGAAWIEGLAFGALAYSREHRGRQPEGLLDRITLANINQMLASASEEGRSEIFTSLASPRALAFVGGARSTQAVWVLRARVRVADHAAIATLVASHWLDGFLVGLVFEELGGHREK